MHTLRRSTHFIANTLILLCLVSVTAISARAEVLKFSDAEKVGFAFYQLIDIEPDFKSWIINSAEYKNASPVEKNQMLHTNLTRLRNAYYHYIPDQDLIELSIKGTVHVSNYFGASQNEGVMTNVKILFDDIPEKFIPFQIGDMWIAVVPQDIESLLNQNMNTAKYKHFATKLKLNQRTFSLKQDINIELRLRPLSADHKEPIMLEEIPMWLMLAEIASFEIWVDGKRGQRLYAMEHYADWYIPAEERMMLNLYDR